MSETVQSITDKNDWKYWTTISDITNSYTPPSFNSLKFIFASPSPNPSGMGVVSDVCELTKDAISKAFDICAGNGTSLYLNLKALLTHPNYTSAKIYHSITHNCLISITPSDSYKIKVVYSYIEKGDGSEEAVNPSILIYYK